MVNCLSQRMVNEMGFEPTEKLTLGCMITYMVAMLVFWIGIAGVAVWGVIKLVNYFTQ